MSPNKLFKSKIFILKSSTVNNLNIQTELKQNKQTTNANDEKENKISCNNLNQLKNI